jgi:hypothetical protein
VPHRGGLRVDKTIPLIAVCWIALAVAVRADSPPAKPTPDLTVEQLVQQLGDNDYRKRDEASRALQGAGARALPALRLAIHDPDAEVRRRVNDLIPALETAVLLAPKRVTFKTVNKPIKDAFDELIRQTGYQIEYNVNEPRRLYSFEFHDAPFWEVIEKISRATGLVIQQGYGDDHIRLYQQNAYAPYVHTEGAFRFTATGFNQYRNIDFSLAGKGSAPQTRNESLTLQFSICIEPKMALLGVGEVHLEAAYDNEKNSMLVPPVNNNELFDVSMNMGGRWTSGKYGNGNRMFSTQSQVNLLRSSENATTVKVVRGTLPIMLLVNQKPVVVAEKILKAKGKKTTIGGTHFEIEDVTEQPGKQYQIKMAVNEDMKDNPNDYSWMNSLAQRIELQDEKGGKMQIMGSQWNNSAANHLEMTLTFGTAGGAKPEAPTKLVYQTWTTEQHVIPFEFKDLPLP